MKLLSSKTDGKISIGIVPYYLFSDLSILSSYFYNKIPDKTKTTYHNYFSEVEQSLKPYLYNLVKDPFFNFCDPLNPNCIQRPIVEMNEFYYSNPKPNFHKTHLYGAAANLIPHRDCILYNFYDIYVYRIIIGLSENINHDVGTNFINFNITHKIQYGEYIAFDFDRTLHQVIKTSNQSTQRMLLKMHYIVCENCHYAYIDFISLFYVLYYRIARYTEQLGTDPTTFVGFFFGIMWEYPFYENTKYVVFFTSSSIFLILDLLPWFYNKKYNGLFSLFNTSNEDIIILKENLKGNIFYTFCYLYILYLIFVFYFWFNYILFRIQ
jgi:hypothetical protein